MVLKERLSKKLNSQEVSLLVQQQETESEHELESIPSIEERIQYFEGRCSFFMRKLKILDKTSNTPLIQLEIPPPPLINAHSAATTGERPMGVQDGNGSADYTQAVDLLKDWTTKNGWHDLQSRLFEAGRTDYRDYAQVVLNTQSR